MADATDEIMARMKSRNDEEEEKKPGKAAKKGTGSFHPRLLIDRRKRFGLLVIIPLALTIFLGILQLSGNTWMHSLGPILAIGALLTWYPVSEQWEYQPWQTRARHYEHHTKG